MQNSPYASKLDISTSRTVWTRFHAALEQAQVPERLCVFHHRWVERWLEGLRGQAPSRDAPLRFSEQLAIKGVPDWQCRQAMRSVECWLEARAQVLESLVVPTDPFQPPKTWQVVIQEMQDALRIQRYSPRTMESYGMWVDRFAKRCPEVPKDDLEASREAGIFLAELALKHNLASASIDQARNSLAWLFRRQMGFDFVLPDKGTAHRGRRIPQVISSAKVRDLLAHCEDPWDLFFSLQYGCGLRLMELLEMRIQEVDLDRRVLTVRHGKGDVDRQCLLPQALHQRIGLHLARRQEVWNADLAKGHATVDLPGAAARTSTDWRWQHLFGASRPLRHPVSGDRRRWRPLETKVREVLREAASRAGIVGHVHPHLLRHCFATHLLEAGVPIQTIQSQLGHAKLQTTLIYLHVKSPAPETTSPLDLMPTPPFKS